MWQFHIASYQSVNQCAMVTFLGINYDWFQDSKYATDKALITSSHVQIHNLAERYSENVMILKVLTLVSKNKGNHENHNYII